MTITRSIAALAAVPLALAGSLLPLTVAAADEPAAAATPAAAEFTKTPRPTISGTVRVGEKVKAVVPAWTPTATSYDYAWFVGSTPVGAGRTLVIDAELTGAPLRVEATGHRGAAEATKSSAEVEVAEGRIPTIEAVIAGTARVGEELTLTSTGSPPPVEGIDFEFAWFADGVQLLGAEEFTFTPVAAQQGQRITATVTASAPGYKDRVFEYGPTKRVRGADFEGLPDLVAVSGDVRAGSTLVADGASGWIPEPAELYYRWKVAGTTKLAGVDADEFLLQGAWVGKKVTLVVTASAAGYEPTSVTRSLGEVGKGALEIVDTGEVTGDFISPSKGDVFVVSTPPTYSAEPDSLTVQWLRDGEVVGTGLSYTLRAADEDAAMRLRFIAKKAGFATSSATYALFGGA